MKKNGNENTTHQNIWDAFRAEIRGKFIALNPFISKNERMIINDTNSQFKTLEKEQQSEHKESSRKERIKMKEEIKEKNREIDLTNKSKSCFFKKNFTKQTNHQLTYEIKEENKNTQGKTSERGHNH